MEEQVLFAEKVIQLQDEIDFAINELQKDYNPSGKDASIDNALEIIKKYIVAESSEELTFIAYSKNLRSKSIEILEKMKSNLATLDENNAFHVKGLETILKYPGRQIIASTSPMSMIDSSDDPKDVAQRSRFVIDLAFLAAFGDSFDYKRFAEDQLRISKLSEDDVKDFFKIFQKEGADASITGDIEEIEKAVISYLGNKKLNKREKIQFLSRAKSVNEYSYAFLFVQKASNEGFTADLLNNALTNIVLFSTANFDNIILDIKNNKI
jgi:hypothetical protein